MKPIIALFSLFFLISCASKSDIIDYDSQNEEDILAYLNDHNLNAQKSSTGLYYIIDNEGTGTRPNSNSNVAVTYKGYFTNETIFDESTTEVTFNLQQVIEGFKEGLTYFKEGGSGKLIIPSRLGYGNKDTTSIPAGSVLVFDITLLRVF